MDKSSRVFIAMVAMMIVVAGSIALPEVWLLPAEPAPVPEEAITNSAESERVREETCIDSRCFTADGSRVIERVGSEHRVAWVINPDNPFTELPKDENGVEENVRIVTMSESAGVLYVELGSGRNVVRDRQGDWTPGVGEFRQVAAPAAIFATLGALLTLGMARLKSGRTSALYVIVAGFIAVLCHLPITIWRFTTAWSLSSVVVPSVALLGFACVAGLLLGSRESGSRNASRT